MAVVDPHSGEPTGETIFAVRQADPHTGEPRSIVTEDGQRFEVVGLGRVVLAPEEEAGGGEVDT
jgi:hypothetical protein